MRIAPWLFGSGVAVIGVAHAAGCGKTPNTGTVLTTTFAAITASASGAGGAGGDGGSGGIMGTGGVAGTGGATPGVGGAGGMGAGGVMNAASSAMSSSSQTSTATGAGGSAPVPMETPIHNCVSTTALDLTSAGAFINIAYVAATDAFSVVMNGVTIPLNYPLCLRIKASQKIVVGGKGSQGGPLLIGGLIDKDGIANYDKKGPLQPNCYMAATSFDPNSGTCYNGGVWPCGTPGANAAAQCQLDTQKAFTAKPYPFYNNTKRDTQQGVLYVMP